MRNLLQSVCLIIILHIIETKSAAFLSKSRNENTKKTYITSATPLLASVSEPATLPNKGDAEYDCNSNDPSLPELFPEFANSLTSLGYATPTPIQDSSAQRALDGENLLLIAPTGSGKTLAYYLPALSKAMREDGTVLVVSPTRELALQLCGDAVSLLSTEMDNPESSVLLAVRGVAPPNPEQLSKATMLIGTPPELYTVLTKVDTGGFIAGDTLSAVILDEADVLLPPPPKGLRTGLDIGSRKKNQKNESSPQDQRRKQEQRRKLLTAKRQGIEFTSTNQIVSPTEKILNMIASSSLMGGDNASPAQILAGSATASRKTLDRLNKSLRNAAVDAALPYDMVWSGDFKACRPVEGPLGVNFTGDSESAQADEAQHTIRAVTVPPQVTHQYVPLSKESATQPTEILKAVASVTKTLNPDIALVFLCGEFAKTKESAKAKAKPVPKGATAKARRNSMLKYKRIAAKVKSQEEKKKKNTTPKDSLSARNACSILKDFGVDAKPLHVALGLEGRDDVDEEDDSTSFLVTFEGSARGLHFDNVDVVFVVGRPTSAASYLHLAGRVGRSSADNGSILVRPGKVVSFCTKGSSKELEKWVKQTGGKSLEELSIS